MRWERADQVAAKIIGVIDSCLAYSMVWRGRLLHAFDPEDAHRLALSGLKLAPLPRRKPDDPKLCTRVFGFNFPDPVGVAPGFDKNDEVPDALFRLGFGFVEIGTVTPRPQKGNPRPRIFGSMPTRP